MNNKTIIIILTLTFLAVNFSTAKPLVEQDSDLSENIPSQLHKLIKRATVAIKSSSKTGFAAIIVTPNVESHKKTRECLEWEKHPLTGKIKCIQFTVHSNKN